MSRVIERATGAQVLPPVDDERRKVSHWAASQCCSADQRAVNPATFGALAADLIVVEDE